MKRALRLLLFFTIVFPPSTYAARPRGPFCSSRIAETKRSERAEKQGIQYLIHVTSLHSLASIFSAGELIAGRDVWASSQTDSQGGLGRFEYEEIYLEAISRRLLGYPLFSEGSSSGWDVPAFTPPANRGAQAILILRRELLDRDDYTPCWGWNFGGDRGEEYPLAEIDKLFRRIFWSPTVANQLRFRMAIPTEDVSEIWVHPEDVGEVPGGLGSRIVARETF